ncbi:MAG: hypothetical protein RIE73_11550 [Coleofasciculus sp. C1-SOL-03]
MNLPSYNYQKKYYRGFMLLYIKFIDRVLQPFMNAFGNKKVTHFWHYQETSAAELENNPDIALSLHSVKEQKRNFKKSFTTFPRNALADLGWVKDAAIIEPIKYEKEWSFVFQDTDSDACQECVLTHKGAVKVLIDGSVIVWGRGQNGEIVQLHLVRMTTVKLDKDILFI